MITRDRLRAGIFLPPFHPNDEDPTLCFERDFELIQWLDKLGYDEAWIGEHHSGGYEIYGSPELFIATAAERTRHIRLGTGVISLPYHHPFMVADRIVQLDYQTRGRAMFGFGPGLLPSDAMMLGIDPETQRDRMAEAIDIIMRLLDGEIVTPESEWFGCARRACSCGRSPGRARTWRSRARSRRTAASSPGKYGLGMLCVAAAQRGRLRRARQQLARRQRDRGAARRRTMDPRRLAPDGADPHRRDARAGGRRTCNGASRSSCTIPIRCAPKARSRSACRRRSTWTTSRSARRPAKPRSARPTTRSRCWSDSGRRPAASAAC